MKGEYIRALEIRAKWLRWAKDRGRNQWLSNGEPQESWVQMMRAYQTSLGVGDTFFMNRQFADLVEHSRETVPDDLTFEASWLQAKAGWLWIETPFKVPIPGDILPSDLEEAKVEMSISAVGWFPAEGNQTFFMCFQDYSQYTTEDRGFGCWSHFLLADGDKLIDRIRQFERSAAKQGSGAYSDNREADNLHEIRWVYAALHLMAQRLTHSSTTATDRNTRRRGERSRLPVTPFIRVISLRRLEEARERAAEAGEVDWQWQWGVRGHWRNQFFSSEGVHRQIFIESYIKGPEGKPLKPMTHNIFIAKR